MLLKNFLTYLLTSNYRFILHDIVPRYSDGNREFLCLNLCNVEVKNFGTRLVLIELGYSWLTIRLSVWTRCRI